MEPESLLLTFERSSQESRLRGVDEAIRALGKNDINVTVAADDRGVYGLFAKVLRFWFPYLSREGVVGVTPDSALGPATEVAEFIVTLAPTRDPLFGAVLGAWLQAQYGRKVRVKIEDIELEAQTSEQAESLLSRLEALRQNRKLARSGQQ